MPSPFARFNPNNPMNGFDFGAIQNMYRNMGNPMQMLQQAAMSNPRLKPVLQAIQGGQNPQQLVYQICQQRGINPQEFLRNITGNNGF